MKYASVSVKFPVELDTEIERFLDETGIYTIDIHLRVNAEESRPHLGYYGLQSTTSVRGWNPRERS